MSCTKSWSQVTRRASRHFSLVCSIPSKSRRARRCASACVIPCHVFLGFSFEVVTQLVVQFLVRVRPAKQRPQPQGNRVQPMLRSHSPILLHSYLNATIGSTFAARRAG